MTIEQIKQNKSKSIPLNISKNAFAKQESQPDWQKAFDATTDIIALISKDHKILKINKAGCEKLGKEPEELIGRKCYEVIHGTDEPITECSCNQAINSKKSSTSEISENGRRYITTASPIYDSNNNIIGLTHTVKDITDKFEAEEELKNSQNEMEKIIDTRTRELIKTNKNLVIEIEERKRAEEKLKKSQIDLKNQSLELEKKNIALQEIIAQIEIEKSKIKEEIRTNVELFLIPTLEKFCNLADSERLLEIVKYQITNLTSSYGIKISDPKYKLTPRELEICNLVTGGLPSKEIAKLLYISITTVNKHRRNIRKKLHITNSDINLSSYLHKF